jgi:hypothetical protein
MHISQYYKFKEIFSDYFIYYNIVNFRVDWYFFSYFGKEKVFVLHKYIDR